MFKNLLKKVKAFKYRIEVMKDYEKWLKAETPEEKKIYENMIKLDGRIIEIIEA